MVVRQPTSRASLHHLRIDRSSIDDDTNEGQRRTPVNRSNTKPVVNLAHAFRSKWTTIELPREAQKFGTAGVEDRFACFPPARAAPAIQRDPTESSRPRGSTKGALDLSCFGIW